jgi:chromosome segregation ATPase
MMRNRDAILEASEVVRHELAALRSRLEQVERELGLTRADLKCVTRNLESLSEHDNDLEDKLRAANAELERVRAALTAVQAGHMEFYSIRRRQMARCKLCHRASELGENFKHREDCPILPVHAELERKPDE